MKKTETVKKPEPKKAPVKTKTKATTPKKQEPATKKPAVTKPRKPKEPEVIELPVMDKFPSVKKGSKEKGYITLLQTNLLNRGYYEGKVDGIFGDKTEAAVMEFQKDLGKPLSGSVGPKTWEALRTSNVTKAKPAPTVVQEEPKPQPQQPSGAGTRVLIEGLSKFQAELLVKLLQGPVECRIL